MFETIKLYFVIWKFRYLKTNFTLNIIHSETMPASILLYSKYWLSTNLFHLLWLFIPSLHVDMFQFSFTAVVADWDFCNKHVYLDSWFMHVKKALYLCYFKMFCQINNEINIYILHRLTSLRKSLALVIKKPKFLIGVINKIGSKNAFSIWQFY